jgi:hypothetical protein
MVKVISSTRLHDTIKKKANTPRYTSDEILRIIFRSAFYPVSLINVTISNIKPRKYLINSHFPPTGNLAASPYRA